MIKSLTLLSLITILSVPAYAGNYVAGSGEPVAVTVSAEIYNESSIFEITEETLKECEDPDNNNPDCSLLIYEDTDTSE